MDNIEYIIISLSIGECTIPSVSGQCCLPASGLIIEKISYNKGIMFGGAVTYGDGMAKVTNSVYIFNVTHNTIVSITLSH